MIEFRSPRLRESPGQMFRALVLCRADEPGWRDGGHAAVQEGTAALEQIPGNKSNRQ